ncbi:Isochorismatase hydrolase [Meredithblackwellia eburnea MCA 4105]
MTSSVSQTAIVLIDVYNDFIHPEGKLYPLLKQSIQATKTTDHMKDLVDTARKHKIPIYYTLHKNWAEGNYAGWERMNTSMKRIDKGKVFEEGSWGAEIYKGLEPDVLGNKDVIASKHWNSSGFANTDLDYLLRQRGITNLIMTGMVANTCLESTARYGRELGYNVTILTDGTAGFTTAAKEAAETHVWPLIVDQVMTTDEWIESLGGEASKL